MKKRRLILISLISLLSITTTLGISTNVKAAKKTVQTIYISNDKSDYLTYSSKGENLVGRKT